MYETLSISCCRWMKLYKLCLSQKNSQSQKNLLTMNIKMLIPVIKPTFLRMIISTFGTRVQSRIC